jgi:hypothetical protein
MSGALEKDAGQPDPWGRWIVALIIIVGCACSFAIVGAFLGIIVCCAKWPDSNLAGMVGIFYGFPIGAAAGAVIGIALAYLVARRW